MVIHPYNRRVQDEARARSEYAQALRREGKSWKAIGDILGVSRQMAHRIGTRYKARKNGTRAFA